MARTEYTITNNTLISGNTPIASGAITTLIGEAALVSPAGGTVTYLWEQSTNGTSWSNAYGTNSGQNYTTPELTETTYYRRKVTVTDGYGDVTTSTTSAITVDVVFSVTTPASQTNQCMNTELSLSTTIKGGTANYTLTLQKYSVVNATTGGAWGDVATISGLTSAGAKTLTLTTVSASAEKWNYRIKCTDAGAVTIYSSVFSITTKSVSGLYRDDSGSPYLWLASSAYFDNGEIYYRYLPAGVRGGLSFASTFEVFTDKACTTPATNLGYAALTNGLDQKYSLFNGGTTEADRTQVLYIRDAVTTSDGCGFHPRITAVKLVKSATIGASPYTSGKPAICAFDNQAKPEGMRLATAASNSVYETEGPDDSGLASGVHRRTALTFRYSTTSSARALAVSRDPRIYTCGTPWYSCVSRGVSRVSLLKGRFDTPCNSGANGQVLDPTGYCYFVPGTCLSSSATPEYHWDLVPGAEQWDKNNHLPVVNAAHDNLWNILFAGTSDASSTLYMGTRQNYCDAGSSNFSALGWANDRGSSYATSTSLDFVLNRSKPLTIPVANKTISAGSYVLTVNVSGGSAPYQEIQAQYWSTAGSASGTATNHGTLLTNQAAGSKSLTLTNPGSSGQTYYWRIRVKDSAGNTSYSDNFYIKVN
jgi:hypothetical protein